jgi:hypothetical protein
MNLQQTGDLLGLAASYDRRPVGDAEIVAWQAALSDVDAADAMAAVVAHYGHHTNWLMPAHVRAGVDQIQRERRRVELDAAHDRHLEQSRFTPAEHSRAAQIIAQLRRRLPPGDPAKLRGEHWLATHGQRQLRGTAADSEATR